MLSREQYDEYNGLELVCIQLEESLSAVLHNALYQLEQALSEFWVRHQIVSDHLQSRVAQVVQDLLQETLKQVSHPFKHGGKEHHHLGVSSIRVTQLIVLHESLESGQELLTKDSHLVLSADVGLDQTEDITSDCLHLLGD